MIFEVQKVRVDDWDLFKCVATIKNTNTNKTYDFDFFLTEFDRINEHYMPMREIKQMLAVEKMSLQIKANEFLYILDSANIELSRTFDSIGRVSPYWSKQAMTHTMRDLDAP